MCKTVECQFTRGLEMERDELKRLLLEATASRKYGYIRFLQSLSNWREVEQCIFQCTSLLQSPKISLKTRIWWILNDVQKIPKCLGCGRAMDDINVCNVNEGYPLHCCKACAADSQHRKDAYAEGFKEKHGVENPSQLESVKQQKVQTCQEHLHVDNPAQAETVKEKTKATCRDRYGVDFTTQSEQMKSASKATCKDRYGKEHYPQTEEFIEKTEASNLKKFGVKYPNQDPELRKKAQKRYSYQGIKLDSALELAFFIWLQETGQDFEYQPSVSFSYMFEGREHKYMPDFRVGDQLIEIKGNQFFKDKDPTKEMVNPYDHSQDALYEAKHQCMLRNRVKILVEADCKKAIDFVKENHGRDYLKQFKTK